MTRTADSIDLAALCRAFRVTDETIRGWRKAGMPTRLVSGRPRFDLPDVIEWRRERDREALRSPELLKESEERAAKLRVERELKQLELDERRGKLVPVQVHHERVESFLGGFAALAAGGLHRFEREIVRAATPGDARTITEKIHRALMEGAMHYADELEAELRELEAAEAAMPSSGNAGATA